MFPRIFSSFMDTKREPCVAEAQHCSFKPTVRPRVLALYVEQKHNNLMKENSVAMDTE